MLNKHRTRVGVLVCMAFLLTLGWNCSKLWAGNTGLTSSCQNKIRAQRYRQAARCFLQQYKQLEKLKDQDSDTPLQKDHYLRRAALSYYRFARESLKPSRQSYYREKAMTLLIRSFQKGYCEAADRCRSNRILAENIRKEIQYTSLAVVTGNRLAHIRVSGFRFQTHTYYQFNQKLRPGPYSIHIQFPDKSVQRKQVILRAGLETTLNITPAQIKTIEHQLLIPKRIPPLIVTGYTVGSVAVVVGLTLAIYGLIEENRLNNIISDPEKARTLPHKEYQSQFGSAQAIKLAGFVAGGAGVTLLISTVVAQIATRRTPAQTRKLFIAKPPTNKTQTPLLIVPGADE